MKILLIQVVQKVGPVGRLICLDAAVLKKIRLGMKSWSLSYPAMKLCKQSDREPAGIMRNVEPVLVHLFCRTAWFVQVSVTGALQGPMDHTGVSDRYLVGPHGSYRCQ